VERKVDALRTWAVVKVQDQGIGVPAAELNHVFRPMARASNAQQIEGAGIGLASAWLIVASHGGTISAESEEGVGSTFSLRLPVSTGQ
jgi:signal transduction histidine kinase